MIFVDFVFFYGICSFGRKIFVGGEIFICFGVIEFLDFFLLFFCDIFFEGVLSFNVFMILFFCFRILKSFILY